MNTFVSAQGAVANGVPLPAAILLAKSAIAAAPLQEMAGLALSLQAGGRVAQAAYAFSEQGSPSLKDVILELRAAGHGEILILPLLLPMEPSFHAWILRTLQRWQLELGGEWPVFRIGQAPSLVPDFKNVMRDVLTSAVAAAPVPHNAKTATEGSVVSERKYRVLVCQGGPCNQAGGAVLWGHLRNCQADAKLADAGKGMRSAKTSCLGPCALAPVVQVYPDGVFYGGVDEAGMDRIVREHLQEGRVVEDLAYRPGPGKQALRGPARLGTCATIF